MTATSSRILRQAGSSFDALSYLSIQPIVSYAASMTDKTLHPDAMQTWAPQRRLTLAQARRRSDRVGMIRMFFVAAAAISAGIIIGPIVASSLNGSSQGITRISGDQVITMINPRFSGRNYAGETYTITAETAQRRRDDPETIDLKRPKLINEHGSEITAPVGVFYQKDDYLYLSQTVSVRESTGYELQTEAADIYVASSQVSGRNPLTGHGPLGSIKADSYEISEDNGRLILRGNVEMTIYPDRRDRPTPDLAKEPDS
ncbi:MAG: hypothetical protein CME93_08675 [Hyphomonadaceae bacterium]|nr:hypothetical protein [Hyphomonadaceae bacterium]OUX93141.1 MAG: hypothetical protein CBB77_10560 [Hyphomonas sp. TMED17]